VAVDSDGHVYTGGNSNGTYTTRAYNSSGTLLWSAFHGSDVFGIAALSPASMGGVPVGLRMGIPTVGFAGLPPGLAIRLALAVPSGTPPPSPPMESNRYRGYVTGGDPLEIPLEWIQCRRRRGDSTWMTVRTGYTAERYAALNARYASAGELLVTAGAVINGIETAGFFLRARMTEVNPERTGWVGGISVVGRVIPTSYSTASRALTNITQRGMTGGLRTVRCAVNALLRPGDTVNDGTASWIAGAILYSISAVDAWMDVTEDS